MYLSMRRCFSVIATEKGTRYNFSSWGKGSSLDVVRNPTSAPAFHQRLRDCERLRKMVKKFPGNFPGKGDLVEAGSFKAHSHEWILFIGPAHHTGWRRMKVCVDGEAPRKGNYWLSFNGDRFAATRDYETMKEHRPKIEEEIMHIIMEMTR